ncbi:MAG: hypothetical protein MJB57_03765, partial [Gemmatimonadetes bacterium]|nr:hypothetical protein [Gemmatimonadota bacterium]
MMLRVPRALRGLAGALALVAYAMPIVLGVVSFVGHNVYHLALEMERQGRIADALSLRHGADDVDEVRRPIAGRVVHAHDGLAPHTHAASIDGLLA